MTEQLPTSMVHPEAPEFLSACALYSAPIDLEAAAARLEVLWNETLDLMWDEVDGGRLLRFTLENVLVLMSPINEAMRVDKGALPEHRFHVAITCYAPLDASQIPGGTPADPEIEALPIEVRRRKRMLAAHVVLTELSDALMREEAAIGLFRPELGVVQPPQMITELADLLSKGQAPLPLWVAIRTFHPDLTHGRTLGLNLFGHLDLEVLDSIRSEAEVYAMLANVTDYIVSSDAFIFPGQTVGFHEGEELPVSQATSEADGASVLNILF